MKTLSQFINEEKPDVYKREGDEYYTYSRKTVNPVTGSTQSARRRKVVDWVAVVGDRHIGGHSTKRSAIATWQRQGRGE